MTIRRLNDSAIRKLRASFISTVAQCVVELAQNSLDALATNIEIHVDMMKFFIQIIDNGTGITPDDMEKIGQRYATSKCHTLEDLAHVTTYGFRGEALATLAEISTLEIISKHPNCYDTYCTILKGGKRLQCGPTRSSKRKKPGTIIIIRDLFYTYPVRRKYISENAFTNELENVKKSIESLALVHPQVTFTLVDASNDIKIVTTRRTATSISTFRQLFGSSLAQNLESVYAEEDNIKFEGFFSLRGFHTRQHQYFYVNKLLISCNKIYKLIDEIFNQSSFGKKNYEGLPLESRSEYLKYKKSFMTRYPEKYPIFFIHLTCPATIYDKCLDPAKSMIEFEDWSKILNLLSALVSQFLLHHGFLLRETETILSLDTSMSIIDKEQTSYKHDLSLSFENVLHIKSGGRKQYTFQDKELKGGSFNDRRYDNLTEHNKDSENNFNMNDTSTDLNSKKLNSHLKAKVDRSKLRTSRFQEGTNDSRAVSWAKETFEKWTNPVFESAEVPIPLLKAITTNNKTSSVTSNFFSRNYSMHSNTSEHRFSKKDIEQAKVIGQLDNKFIVCKLPCTQYIDQGIEEKRNILVLVDQHAADERVRIEMLLKEFCEFKLKQSDRMDIEDNSVLQPSNSFVETIQLKPSNKIILTFRETQVIERFESNFNRWGIFFSTKPDSASNMSTSFVSPHFVSSKGGDHIPLYVTHLPKMIADRCALDTRITQEIVRQHLYWLEETGGVGTDFNANEDIDESREWRIMIRKCPRGIIDILNSKACRGAIKFNDKLSLQQCEELIAKLAECVFPFQCAHGRPSMIPVLYLNDAPKHNPVYRNSAQLGSYVRRNIGIRSLTSINQTDRNGSSSSWKLRKIDFERFRL
ncbi:hypothetical protein RclHR1_12870007 [Rhizophagus clarus]|uniref:MutL C-terminal dimerisation domain-containing protein n=1 Tax=Rhizophagus clarus TaxID=94130 RepID=A0A2Z6QA20_9GLOM|nr:hypothetical protein RclHR1_12870007 [Rhizophagus clarus]GES88414.1 hypothetical protein RCL_jg5323.t1 [Rhizophagus clarus]